jgi:hypothetical protein
MEPTNSDNQPVKCEICGDRLLFPLNNTWLRPEAYGGSVCMKLCTQCEREFWKLTSLLHSRALDILTNQFDAKLEKLRKQIEQERRQCKLPVV